MVNNFCNYMKICLLGAVCLMSTLTQAQQPHNDLNRDSVLLSLINKLPEDEKADALKIYEEGSEAEKMMLAFKVWMPRSSKKEMIANIDSNSTAIRELNTAYAQLVPANYIVSIEYNPAEPLLQMGETIDIAIRDTTKDWSNVQQDWGLPYNARKLSRLIKPLGWTTATLQKIKKLLGAAHCISIENGDITTVGFARSGLGKYSFKIFKENLTAQEIAEYNNQCTYIYYKNNIVLEYGGGAAGPQCFPD
jgi:hypothetical protein